MGRLTVRHPSAQKLSTNKRSGFFYSQDTHPLAAGLFADEIELQVIAAQDRGMVNQSVSDSVSDTRGTRKIERYHYMLSFPKSGLHTTRAYRFASDGFSNFDTKVTLPTTLMEQLHWHTSDSLVRKKCPAPNRWVIKNLSVRMLFPTKARRNLISLINALNNPLDPLARVLVRPRNSYREPVVMLGASSAALFEKKLRISAETLYGL